MKRGGRGGKKTENQREMMKRRGKKTENKRENDDDIYRTEADRREETRVCV